MRCSEGGFLIAEISAGAASNRFTVEKAMGGGTYEKSPVISKEPCLGLAGVGTAERSRFSFHLVFRPHQFHFSSGLFWLEQTDSRFVAKGGSDCLECSRSRRQELALTSCQW